MMYTYILCVHSEIWNMHSICMCSMYDVCMYIEHICLMGAWCVCIIQCSCELYM